MLDAIERDNPTFNYSLLESPGQDPTDLQVKTAEKLIRDLKSSRETYVKKNSISLQPEKYTLPVTLPAILPETKPITGCLKTSSRRTKNWIPA